LTEKKSNAVLDIFFTAAASNNYYQAQVAVSSQRPIYTGDEKSDRTTLVMRILDNNWNFAYTPNQRMNHDE